jgi:hypothetical protein
MRVMVIVKATEDSEKGVPPTPEAFEAMDRFTEELVEAGVMVAGAGLKPSATQGGSPSTVRAARSPTGRSRKRASWSPASRSGR